MINILREKKCKKENIFKISCFIFTQAKFHYKKGTEKKRWIYGRKTLRFWPKTDLNQEKAPFPCEAARILPGNPSGRRSCVAAAAAPNPSQKCNYVEKDFGEEKTRGWGPGDFLTARRGQRVEAVGIRIPFPGSVWPPNPHLPGGRGGGEGLCLSNALQHAPGQHTAARPARPSGRPAGHVICLIDEPTRMVFWPCPKNPDRCGRPGAGCPGREARSGHGSANAAGEAS